VNIRRNCYGQGKSFCFPISQAQNQSSRLTNQSSTAGNMISFRTDRNPNFTHQHWFPEFVELFALAFAKESTIHNTTS